MSLLVGRSPGATVNRGRIAAAALLVSSLATTPAAAQALASKGTASSDYQSVPKFLQPGPETDLLNLSGFGKGFGQDLAERGIYLRGSYMADLFGNVAGGRQTGSVFTSMALAGVDLDLGTILDIHGGALHVTVGDRNGPTESSYTGSFTLESDTYGPFRQDAVRLSDFNWTQSLFDDHLRFEVGRTQWSPEFARSDLAFQFVGYETINVGATAFDTNASFFTVGYWGGRITLRPTRPLYLRLGAYEVNPDNALSSEADLPGTSWSLRSATGAFVPVELGYNRNDFRHLRYPFETDVGFTWDTSRYNDFYYNSRHLPLAQAGGTALAHKGRTTIYWEGQKVVWRPDPATRRNLEVFANAGWNIGGDALIKNSMTAGLVLRGTFPSRTNDTIGLVFDDFQYNSRLSEDLNAEIAAGGGSGTLTRNQQFVELNYGYELAPGLLVKPFGEYVAHPDQFNTGRPEASDTHAWVAGLQVWMIFNSAFGLPEMENRT